MSRNYHIAVDEEGPRGGGGPEDDSRFPERTLRSHGFIPIVFGFALGLSLIIMIGISRIFDGIGIIDVCGKEVPSVTPANQIPGTENPSPQNKENSTPNVKDERSHSSLRQLYCDFISLSSENLLNLFYTFLFGFIVGTVISGIYNVLVFRRLNLFGIDKNMD